MPNNMIGNHNCSIDYAKLLQEEYGFFVKKVTPNSCIVLYGYSVVSVILKVAIKELGFENRIVIFDKGRCLDSNYDFHESSDISIVILCSSRKATRNSMKDDIYQLFSCVEVIDFFPIYYLWITRVVKRNCNHFAFAETLVRCRNEDCIPNIDSINTFRCNLRCKECSNGVPYRNNKPVDYNIDEHIDSLNKITSFFPITQCNFQGGEVFLDKNFKTFLVKHEENPHVAIFTIATNGTILPPDETFKTIKTIGAMIRISDYGTLSRNKENIIKKCKEYNIPCFIFPAAQSWCKFGDFKKRNRSFSELEHIANNCFFGTHDLMFAGNKIYCCLRTLYSDAIGYNSDETRANTLDLQSNFNISDLKSIINGDNLWMMCDYCDYPMDSIPPGEQLRGALNGKGNK